MNRFQRVAHKIIDCVEYSIRMTHPDIDIMASSLEVNLCFMEKIAIISKIKTQK
jgi:hypothetical protein